jgi:hypothetical protein
VKYVHVGQGGQAIVGNVSQAAPKDAPPADDSRVIESGAIEAPNEQPMEILTPTEPAATAPVASGDEARASSQLIESLGIPMEGRF